ncbi:ABC transporter substrate-binding protein [Prauserella oleivorans]
MRIVSLLPAATDIVVELGRLPDLVGRTHECDWPAGVASVPVVTASGVDSSLASREISTAVGGAHRGSSLYTVDSERLAALAPDLVLTQDLCEVCAVSYTQVAAAVRMLDAGPRVLSLEPRTLEEVLDSLRVVGAALGAEDVAADRIGSLRHRLDVVRHRVAGAPRPRVVALEWLDPLWPAGHWVPEQIEAAGGQALLAGRGEHTAPVTWDAVRQASPDVLLLLPCGLPGARPRRAGGPGRAARLARAARGAELRRVGARRPGVLQPAGTARRARDRSAGTRAARRRPGRAGDGHRGPPGDVVTR